MASTSQTPMDTSATRLEMLVRLSAEVADCSSRRDKIGLIADLLGRLDREETALAASYLAGEIPQGGLGVGSALVEALRGLAPVDRGRLTLGDRDRTFDALLGVKGTGAQAQRRELLRMLFEQATHEADPVLDGEVLALRPYGRPHPFQTSMRRCGRRLDVASLRAELPLSAFFSRSPSTSRRIVHSIRVGSPCASPA